VQQFFESVNFSASKHRFSQSKQELRKNNAPLFLTSVLICIAYDKQPLIRQSQTQPNTTKHYLQVGLFVSKHEPQAAVVALFDAGGGVANGGNVVCYYGGGGSRNATHNTAECKTCCCGVSLFCCCVVSPAAYVVASVGSAFVSCGPAVVSAGNVYILCEARPDLMIIYVAG
jgi:hypothetical protein